MLQITTVMLVNGHQINTDSRKRTSHAHNRRLGPKITQHPPCQRQAVELHDCHVTLQTYVHKTAAE